MSNGTTDKVQGAVNKTVGRAKQGAGNATDNDRIKGEGMVQEAKGHLQNGKGEVKDAIKKAIDE